MCRKLVYPLVLLLLLFSPAMALAATSEELVIDGGFESGTIGEAPSEPWEVEVANTNTITIVGEQSPFGPLGHIKSAKIERNSATGSANLEQRLSFDDSDFVIMSCDVMLVEGTETFSIRLGGMSEETNGVSLTLSEFGGLKALEGAGTERVIFDASKIEAGKWYRLQAIIPGMSGGTYRVALEEYGGARLVSDSIGVTKVLPSSGSTGKVTVDNVSLIILSPDKVPVIESQTPSHGASSKERPRSVTAGFDEDLVAVDLTGITIRDAEGNSPSGVAAVLEADNRTVSISWNGDLADGTYTVTIPAGALENLIGNGNGEITWSFTVDTTAPIIQSVTITPGVVPRGGEVVISVNAQDATGISGGLVSIYSPEGQKLADMVLNEASGFLSCVWAVPSSSPLGTWKVGSITLIDSLGNQGEYTCDYTFQVDEEAEPLTPISVALLSPLGGERWSGVKAIQWDAEGDDLRINLFYSHDGGSTWTRIAEGLENTREYLWDTSAVPMAGNEFVVRVQATDGVNTEYDESGFFTIVFIEAKRVLAGPTVARTSTTFYYDFEEDGYLHIYNSSARLVYKTRVYAVDGYYQWDLTDLNGHALGNGIYGYRLITDSGEMSEVGFLRIERGSGLAN